MEIDPQFVRAVRDELNDMDADELRDRASHLLCDGPEMGTRLDERRWELYEEIIAELGPLDPGRPQALRRLRDFCFNEMLAARRRLA